MEKFKRYEVITYADVDNPLPLETYTDEKPECSTVKDATAAARKYLKEGYNGACIWDYKTETVRKIFGYFPENSLPRK